MVRDFAPGCDRDRDLYYDLDEYEFAQLLEDLRKRIEDLKSERQYLNKLASEQYHTIKELQEKLKKRRATWG